MDGLYHVYIIGKYQKHRAGSRITSLKVALILREVT